MATNFEHPQLNTAVEAEERQRSGSTDYTNTDEWDASKTLPSRFQKRKGSIFSTPSSRDGHVERNRDAVEEFHKAHSKRWSISSKASSTGGDVAAQASSPTQEKERRKSSVSNAAA
ncbi:hypothetical protein F5Y18DRAFT_30669 [Xylariaceae sp. FL1019]|nr:hypothetical protein F5Y18DRAFT_30669 [Xylariaceae sp. FL1019]